MKTDINKFIKMVYNKSLLIILFLMTVLFTQSCSNQLEMFSEDIFNETQKKEVSQNNEKNFEPLKFSTWEEQLDYLINETQEVNFITAQGLHPIEYKLLNNTINKNLSLTGVSYLPYYGELNYPNNFRIMLLSQIKECGSSKGQNNSGFKKILLENYSDSDLKNVQLRWKYNENEFTTICFVTEKEVVYDDILSNIRIKTHTKNDDLIKKSSLRLKSGNEEVEGEISYGRTTDRSEIYSWTRELMAYAYCQFNVTGHVINGNKSI